MQRRGAGIFYVVRCAGLDAQGIANTDFKFFITKKHHALALGDMVELFREFVLMTVGSLSRLYNCLGQALILISVIPGMHQLPYFRVILGTV
jgi:hypothetical protein